MEETTLENMRLRKVGRGTYYCQSQSDGSKEYLVDVFANDGLGECDCPDFRFRRYPHWVGSKIPFDSFRCRHLRRVRCHVLDQILFDILEKEKHQNPVDAPPKRQYKLQPSNPNQTK